MKFDIFTAAAGQLSLCLILMASACSDQFSELEKTKAESTPDKVASSLSANAGPDRTVSSGDNVVLEAIAAVADRGNISYQWRLLSDGVVLDVQNDTQAQASFVAPATQSTLLLEFQLTLTHRDGRVANDVVYITVVPLPTIVQFSLSSSQIYNGQSADLNISFSNGNGVVDNGIGAVTSGQTIHLSPQRTTTYTLSVINAAGSLVKLSQTLTVLTVDPIDFYRFYSSRSPIAIGQTTQLIAEFNNATAEIDNGIGPVTSGQRIDVTPQQTTRYTLTLKSPDGQQKTESLTIVIYSGVFRIKPTDMSTIDDHSCAIDNQGVICWGSSQNNQNVVPSLSNPKKVLVIADNNCALDDSGVVCWGGTSPSVASSPRLVHARDFTTYDQDACAIDDTGVVCWGGNVLSGVRRLPDIVNAISVIMNSSLICVIDKLDSGNNASKCWNNNLLSQDLGPAVSLEANLTASQASINPQRLEMGSNNYCFSTDNNIYSTGCGVGNYMQPENITNRFGELAVFDIAVGFNHVCRISGIDLLRYLDCWDSLDARNIVPLPMSNEFDRVPTPAKLERIVSGLNQNCVYQSTLDRFYCWGNLGMRPSIITKYTTPATYIDVGYRRVCWAYEADLIAYCDGLGVSVQGSILYKIAIPLPALPLQISTGSEFSCALVQNIGLNPFASCWSNIPLFQISIYGFTNPKQIAIQGSDLCALDENTVICYRINGGVYTQASPDIQTMSQSNEPIFPYQIGGGENGWCIAYSTHQQYVYNGKLVANQEIYCGDGINQSVTIKASIVDEDNLKLMFGAKSICAYSTINGMYCWDKSKTVQLPQEATQFAVNSPAAFSGSSPRPCLWSLGLKLVCAPGEEDKYGLYKNTPTLYTIPTQISVDDYMACAVVSRELRCWGINDDAPTYIQYDHL